MWSLTGEKGVSALEAWGTTRGKGVTVAVLDSGITAHPDLDANVLPGYDFIAESAFSNDGNGRDSDPTDAGNWTVDNQCFTGSKATASDWHGTHVRALSPLSQTTMRHRRCGTRGEDRARARSGRCGGSTRTSPTALLGRRW